MSDHVLIAPEGDTSRRRHAHLECVAAADLPGRPTRPGLLSRRESVAQAGRSATLLACGCIPLLMIAGTLEGFVSPSGLPGGVKFLIGLTTGISLYLYLFLCARGTEVGESGSRGVSTDTQHV